MQNVLKTPKSIISVKKGRKYIKNTKTKKIVPKMLKKEKNYIKTYQNSKSIISLKKARKYIKNTKNSKITKFKRKKRCKLILKIKNIKSFVPVLSIFASFRQK